MQRFTLVHDGSWQGWQAAYLAFYVAAQLGAPLQVLILTSDSDKNMLANRAAQVEVGGHAAGVAIGTQFISEFSIGNVLESSGDSNGLFVPRGLVPDEKTARDFLETLSCPLWLVSKELETNGIVILVDTYVVQESLINYAVALSQRIQQPLTGLILEGELASISMADSDINWHLLPDFSLSTITAALNQVNASLIILPVTSFALSDMLSLNCVIYRE